VIPNTTVLSVVQRGDDVQTTVLLPGVAAPPIAPASLWRSDDSKAIDLHILDSIDGARAKFLTRGWPGPFPETGEELGLVSWWTSEQQDLVMAGPGPWSRATFVATDSLRRSAADGTIVEIDQSEATGSEWDGALRVSGGWNHGHCQVDWANITDGETAYRDGKRWLCEQCYRLYVLDGPPWLRVADDGR
jgi:hypothetical protein